jgi:predicted dehydrogenase
MPNKPRLGIVGLGAQGSVYAELITGGMVPNMELGAICDGNPATRQVVESKYPAAAFSDDYLTMLESATVDAVVICVPSYLHPQMGIDALQRGIHVLLEKPAGIYTKQVKELNAVAATKPELTFAIMRWDRRDPAHQLDHYDVVAAAGLLRPGDLAGDLGR